MSAGPGVSLGPTASPPPKRTDPDLRRWLVTVGRCLRSFHRPVCGNKIKHPYLFLPSWKGTPPWGPDHGFLLGGEVLGREKGAGRAAHRPAPPPPPVHPSPWAPAQGPASCSPGHWSSLTRRSFPSSPPRMETCWLDPGHWRPFELVLRPTSGRGAARTHQQLRKPMCSGNSGGRRAGTLLRI